MLEAIIGKVTMIAAPFMLAVGGQKEINYTRIIEAVVIGAVVAAGGYFVALPVLQKEVQIIQRDISDLKQSLKEGREDLERRAVKRDLEQAAQDARIERLQLEVARNLPRKDRN